MGITAAKNFGSDVGTCLVEGTIGDIFLQHLKERRTMYGYQFEVHLNERFQIYKVDKSQNGMELRLTAQVRVVGIDVRPEDTKVMKIPLTVDDASSMGELERIVQSL